ncbi:MAG: flavin reductase family protein [Oscillibacter sp.]|nr:flavin reductase family protein [Oscillibacter sp.]
MDLHPVDPREISTRLLSLTGNGFGALLTAGTAEHCNTMTIGWYQMGVLWNTLVCTAYVRPERYTYGFMEEHSYFTISAFLHSPEASKTLGLCGSRSGRDTDKITDCGLTVCTGAGGAPYFQEAELVLVCKKLYAQDLDPAAVCDAGKERILPFYGAHGNWHRAYTGEVVEAYSK